MAKVIASTTVLPPIAWNLSDSDQPGVDDFWGDVPEASSSVVQLQTLLSTPAISHRLHHSSISYVIADTPESLQAATAY